MARIVALDYGGKRTGIAVTDPLQIIATELKTIPTKDLLDFLKKYCTEEKVEIIVVGQPHRMSGEVSDIETEILKFLLKLKIELPALEVVRIDETFTSKMAQRSMIESGVKKKDRRDKSRLDSISATLILQDYMEMRL